MMNIFAVLFLVIFSLNSINGLIFDQNLCKKCSQPQRASGRIIGGIPTLQEEAKWIASVQTLNPPELEKILAEMVVEEPSIRNINAILSQHNCAATILNDDWVVTAAHCVDNVTINEIGIGTGSRDLVWQFYNVRKEVSRVVIHPMYYHPHRLDTRWRTVAHDLFLLRNGMDISNVKFTKNDIALLKLKEPFDFSGNKIEPACFTRQRNLADEYTVYGWGKSQRRNTLKLFGLYLDNEEDYWEDKMMTRFLSKLEMTSDVNEWPRGSRDTPLLRNCEDDELQCFHSILHHSNICFGDSGGPVTFYENGKQFVTGLLSAGESHVLRMHGLIEYEKECAGPSYFTRIDSYLAWIESIIGTNQYCLTH